MSALNSVVSAYLEFAEMQARRRIPMYMSDWIETLDGFLNLSKHKILTHAEELALRQLNLDLSELPAQIKGMLLIIKSNDEIYSFVLDMDNIFIAIKGKGESGVIGVATLQSGTDSNEIYKTYNISACTMPTYYEYIMNFAKNHQHIAFNYDAMEGEVILLKDEKDTVEDGK